ncbi:MAG TPA: hypothetical protein VGL35_03105 [Rhizomicrobium sp.]
MRTLSHRIVMAAQAAAVASLLGAGAMAVAPTTAHAQMMRHGAVVNRGGAFVRDRDDRFARDRDDRFFRDRDGRFFRGGRVGIGIGFYGYPYYGGYYPYDSGYYPYGCDYDDYYNGYCAY